MCLSSDGLIKAVGPTDTIKAQYSEVSFDKVIDATGMCVVPGEYHVSKAEVVQFLELHARIQTTTT